MDRLQRLNYKAQVAENKKESLLCQKKRATLHRAAFVYAQLRQCQEGYPEKHSAGRNSELLRRGNKFIM